MEIRNLGHLVCACPRSVWAATTSAAASTGGDHASRDPQGARPRHHAVRHRRHLWRARRLRRPAWARSSATTASASCWRPNSACRWMTTAIKVGGSRRYIMTAVEDSLRRLRTDWIDLYQMHQPDPTHADRGDAARARRPDPPGQGALYRLLELPGLAGGGGALDGETLRAECVRLLPGRIFAGAPQAGSRADAGDAQAGAWDCCRISRWPAGC